MTEDIKLDRFSKKSGVYLFKVDDDMYEAVDYYLRLGFTPEVICNQIEFGCLNVDSSEIRRLYNIYKRR